MSASKSELSSGSLVPTAAGVLAGVALGFGIARAQKKKAWEVLGDKSGGAHGSMMISQNRRHLLKPLDQKGRSEVEVRNYDLLRRTSLGPFLCGFHGVVQLNGCDYMEIDSAYAGMTGKCATLDIKLGKVTWEDNADPAKIAKETKNFEEHYAKSSAAEGFRVAGMKAGGLELSAKKNLKARGSLKTSEFAQWLLPAFFAGGPGYGPLPDGRAGECEPEARGTTPDMQAAREILCHLKVLQAASELGFGFTIRASSLLFTREMKDGGSWNVKLIDLAHVTPSEDKRDHNFCDGLANFISVFEAWSGGK